MKGLETRVQHLELSNPRRRVIVGYLRVDGVDDGMVTVDGKPITRAEWQAQVARPDVYAILVRYENNWREAKTLEGAGNEQ